MSAFLFVYGLGLLLGLSCVLGSAMHDDVVGKPPRVVVLNAARRLLMAAVWPIAVPVYLAHATVRNEW